MLGNLLHKTTSADILDTYLLALLRLNTVNYAAYLIATFLSLTFFSYNMEETIASIRLVG